MRHRLTAAAAAFWIAFVPLLAASQDAYPDPSETIHLIIPNSAGGGTDIAGRLLAEGLEQKLGTTVIVENLSGAGGIEGATQLMDAAPDGYTLGLVPIPQVSMYYLDPRARRQLQARDDGRGRRPARLRPARDRGRRGQPLSRRSTTSCRRAKDGSRLDHLGEQLGARGPAICRCCASTRWRASI